MGKSVNITIHIDRLVESVNISIDPKGKRTAEIVKRECDREFQRVARVCSELVKSKLIEIIEESDFKDIYD